MDEKFEDAEVDVSNNQPKSEEILEIADFIYWYGEKCLEMKQLEKRFINTQKQLIGTQASLTSLKQSQVDFETLSKEKEAVVEALEKEKKAAVEYGKSLEDKIHKVALERDGAHKQASELKMEILRLKRKSKKKAG